jgi:hypothetical protein
MLVLDYGEPPAKVVEGWLVAALVELPPVLRLQAALVALDLVASARTWGTAPFVVQLYVTDSGCALVIMVDDRTPADVRTVPDPDVLLVAGLSSQWGVEKRADGRTLWALIGSEAGSTPFRIRGRPEPGDRPQW